MKLGDSLIIFSQIINITIFIYFILNLLKLNLLDAVGLLISAFGILAVIVASSVSTLE